MFSFIRELIAKLRNPDPDSSAYFIGSSTRLFLMAGAVVAVATVAYLAEDHSLHKDAFCLSGMALNTAVVGFLVLSAIFLGMRLYYSLWKGRVMSMPVMLQLGLLLPILLSVFTRVFSLPVYLMPKSSNTIVISNLFSLIGFLFAGQAAYYILRIVNANLKAD